MVDLSDGKVPLMIFCLLITIVVSILTYAVPPAQAENYGNLSIQPTILQQELPDFFKRVAPIMIVCSLPILYFLYQEFKSSKGVDLK